MTTLIIAEKPAQARDFAAALGISKSGPGFIELKDGSLITWAIGHLLELVAPADYDEAWAKWNWATLPMVPEPFKMRASERTKTHFKLVQALVKKATRIVIATDAGREGELIGREILEVCKFKGAVDRLWCSSMTPADIRKAFGALIPGVQKEPLWEAAKARQHADWLIGLNMTRGVTLAAREAGALAVGRVKTPTLAMVVRRDKQIAGFKAQEFYEIEATVSTAKGETFKMLHAPAEDQRITAKADAEARLKRAEKFSGPIRMENTAEAQSPPLPFTLTALQSKCNAALGLSVQATLDIAQELYEKKKVISYPRSDCEYLASSQKEQVPGVLSALEPNFPGAVAELRKTGLTLRDSTFDDSKLSDHYGIIPTAVTAQLSGAELAVYTIIAQRYMETVSADMKYMQLKLRLDANGVEFRASGRTITAEGWRQIRTLM